MKRYDDLDNFNEACGRLGDAIRAVFLPLITFVVESLAAALEVLRDPRRLWAPAPKPETITLHGRPVDFHALLDMAQHFVDLARDLREGRIRYKSGGVYLDGRHRVIADLVLEDKPPRTTSSFSMYANGWICPACDRDNPDEVSPCVERETCEGCGAPRP